MKNTRKIISVLLSVLMIITSVPLMAVESFAADPVQSGTTGECTWTLDSDGVLTISGKGGMGDYWESNRGPWGTSITKVVIEDGVTSIGGRAFSGCKSLTSVNIPDSVTYIDSYAFEKCTSLTSITIPDSVTYIGSYAFYNCTSLTSVTIPDSVTSIGSFTFFGCKSLTSVTIPDSVTSIGDSAFENTAYYNNESNWENSLLYIGNHLIKAKEDVSGNFEIKQGTKTIAGCAFKNCTSLTSVTIPDSVTSISWYAFSGCKSLTSITIGSGVTEIGEKAFENCTSLTSINIPDSVTSIDGGTFSGCTSLTSVNIPDSVTSIGNSAFFNCISLKRVYIPDTVTTIGEHAFGYYYTDYGVQVEIEGFTIVGKSGSVAQTYAEENGFAFVCLESIIALSESSLAFGLIGKTATLTVTAVPSDSEIVWKSSNENVVTVENGVVTAKGAGNATITAIITVNGIEYSAKCAVSVVLLDSISVTKLPTKTEYFIGDTLDTTGLEITAKYTDNTKKVIDSDLTITGFDSSVAGKNTITIAYDGKTATFDVEIKTPSIALSESSLAFDLIGKTATLTATTVPSDSKIVWKSSNDSVATVENGVVTAKGAGTATITATITVNGIEYSAKCAVDVKLPTMTFPDVRSGDWYYEAVKYNFERGYITGYSNGTFGPSNNIQRQDFVLILARIAGADLSAYEGQNGGFSDVQTGSYYASAVAWAKDTGVANGFSADNFGVGTFISREQICIIFSRYLNGSASGDVDSIINAYSDGGNTSPWAKAGVAWAIENGIIGNAGYINPIGNAGRAEVAQIIYNMANNGIL